MRHPCFPRDFRLLKGGGTGTPTTYAPPAPPTAANAATIQAQADARQKALEEQGINSTLLKGTAGQSTSAQQGQLAAGGFFAPQSPAKNNLLGGG